MEAAAQAALRNWVHESIAADPAARISTERVLDIAMAARAFLVNPYWIRMATMLKNSERAEMETLLSPSASETELAMSRAAVAYIRRILAMPHSDIENGNAAVKAVEQFEARGGVRRSA